MATGQLSRAKAGMRRLAVPLTAPLLPAHIRANMGGLQRAGFLASSGMGVLVLINHFSLRDGFDTFRLLFSHPALRRLPMLAPAASHLIDRRLRFLAALFAVDLTPITSPEAVANLGLPADSGENALASSQKAIAHLDAGGVVLLAPQAGRRPCLEPPARMRPVSLLLAQAQRKRMTDFCLLFAGLGLASGTDYGLAAAGGLNLGQRYEVRVGEAYMFDEAVALAGSLRQVEGWVYAQLAGLVPAAYLCEEE
ncbi:MAG: hypothetical protein RRC07_02435 [Anaerolineae bacterium]|nr:hypothetical protein [Anaerolineae bacterium]